MNYLREINAFYDWLETNSISDSSIVLWFALMHINNKAGWVREFAVAISTLETKTGLKKGAILRARQRLQQMGRIEFRSRNGQMSAIYRIIYFDTEFNNESKDEDKNKDKNENNAEDKTKVDVKNDCGVLRNSNQYTNRSTNRTKTETQTGPVNKLNKTKLDKTKLDKIKFNNYVVNNNVLKSDSNLKDKAILQKIQKTFDQNIHPMTPVELSDIEDWLNKNFESDVIIAAINIAVRENKRFMRYINGILMNWNRLGLKTVEAVEAHNREWQERYNVKGGMVNDKNGRTGMSSRAARPDEANGAGGPRGPNTSNKPDTEYESYEAGIGIKI